MLKIIRSLYKSYRLMIYAIKNRKKFVADKEKIKSRLSICRGSERFDFVDKCDKKIDVTPFLLIFNGEKCGECGCFLKAKTKLDFEKCPINKW